MTDITLAPDAPLDQVEWRVQGKVDKGGGVQVVAYLDAPTVSKLLDDWVGPDRWKDHYEPTGKAGTMWCHLSVKFGDEWITKEDIGTASDMEADKGLVSDAFKRVAMRKWGVGRNVFALPVLRITKFRQVERQGKDPMAYLTGESHAEIADRLRRLGFEDAAEHAEKAAVAGAPDTTDDPAVDVERQELLDELETLLAKAAEVGADGDPDQARTYAAKSPAHARKAIESVQAKIEAATGPDEPDAEITYPDQDEPTVDPATCDHAGSIDRIGIARTRCRACGATFGAHGPNGQGVTDEGAPADAEPAAADESWRTVAEDLNVAPTAVLAHLVKTWPRNNMAARPNRLADIDRIAATDDGAALVADAIGDLARGGEAATA